MPPRTDSCWRRGSLVDTQKGCPVFFSEKYTPADAAILETFVVPRYLSLFGDLMLEMILVGDSARIAHLGCRTGFPDLKLYERLDGVDIVGVDSSLPALELARNKAAVLGDVSVAYPLFRPFCA